LLSKVSQVNDKIISQSLEIAIRILLDGWLMYFSIFQKRFTHRVFDLPVSRKEIADFISMSTANVIRTLSDFKRDGIITIDGKTIDITDMPKLEMIAKRG
jgi:CRP-like cAMP-binding protein